MELLGGLGKEIREGGGEDDFVGIEDLIITCVESFDFHDNAIMCFVGVGGSLMKV